MGCENIPIFVAHTLTSDGLNVSKTSPSPSPPVAAAGAAAAAVRRREEHDPDVNLMSSVVEHLLLKPVDVAELSSKKQKLVLIVDKKTHIITTTDLHVIIVEDERKGGRFCGQGR